MADGFSDLCMHFPDDTNLALLPYSAYQTHHNGRVRLSIFLMSGYKNQTGLFEVENYFEFVSYGFAALLGWLMDFRSFYACP